MRVSHNHSFKSCCLLLLNCVSLCGHNVIVVIGVIFSCTSKAEIFSWLRGLFVCFVFFPKTNAEVEYEAGTVRLGHPLDISQHPSIEGTPPRVNICAWVARRGAARLALLTVGIN